MTNRIAILGSTGSIGINTLDVILRLGAGFKVTALAADSNIKLLADQAARFRPRIISVGNRVLAQKARYAVGSGTKIVYGREGLEEIASRSDIDIVVFATSGCSCVAPLAKAIKNRKRIALANKESLVSAGEMIMKLAAKNGVRIIPVDSEHSAIFQCLDGRADRPAKIYLTGSGGPLLDVAKNRFDSLSRGFVLRHPRWKMGRKISVDSATMMNKGLEIIEAKHLFGMDDSKIEVLIHPEAIVHSMVEFVDGSVLAQLGTPNMRLPIQYALTYPRRLTSTVEKTDFPKIGRLTFREADTKKFPCLELARRASRSGGTSPAALCAADEEAVAAYLDGHIRFSAIPKIIEKVLSRHKSIAGTPSLNEVLYTEAWAREEARSICCH